MEKGSNGIYSSLVAVYISIPCVIFICMVTAVIILILLRRRRKRARQNESVAVYSGNDLTPKRDSLPGVTNKTYSSHSLKIVETSDHSDGTGYVSIVPDSHYMDVCLNDEHLSEAASNETKAINIKANGIEDDGYGYNHLNDSQQQEAIPNTSYSKITICENGLITEEVGITYSHIRNDKAGEGTAKIEEDDTYNKLNNLQNKTATRKDCYEVNENSVYDHAKAGGRNPESHETDEYSHII